MKGTNKLKEHMEINWYFSTHTEVSVNQKIINICEHIVKMAPSNSSTVYIYIRKYIQRIEFVYYHKNAYLHKQSAIAYKLVTG